MGYNGSCAVWKKGNIVILNFDLGYGARQPTDGIQTIFTIPEDYRPNMQLTKFWLGSNGIDTVGYFWRIMPDGTITLQSQTDVAGKNIWMVDFFAWYV